MPYREGELNRRKLIQLGGSVLLGSLASRPALAQSKGTVGITTDRIRVGMSAPFRGVLSHLGSEYYRGAQACFSQINSRGGVYGRKIQLIALDDGGMARKAHINTIQLIEKDPVFALFNYVGSTSVEQALPLVYERIDDGLFLFGNLSGAQIQRQLPYNKRVFNIRPSYIEEMKALVDQFWDLGLRKIAVFYQIDTYGRSGTLGVQTALRKYGAKPVAEATYRAGQGFETNMIAAAKHLQKYKPDAILCTATAGAAAALVRDVRNLGWDVPICNLSTVGSETMVDLLQTEGLRTGRNYTKRLVNAEVVPNYNFSDLPLVRNYRTSIDTWNPISPVPVSESGFKSRRYSFTGLEGFVNASILVQALQNTGSALSRARCYRTIESMTGTDIGMGESLSFSRDEHQALHAVYFNTVQGNRWVPVDDWAAASGAEVQ